MQADAPMRYRVVINDDEQYSIWPEQRENPLGWRDVGIAGAEAECLTWINDNWSDMRPAHVKRAAATMAAAAPAVELSLPVETSLVDRLCSELQRVRLSRIENLRQLGQQVEHGYVIVGFQGMQGATELGFSLDPARTNVRDADFRAGTGVIQLVGSVVLDGHALEIDVTAMLPSLDGSARVVRREAPPP